MRRYKFLKEDQVYNVLNKLRNAFLSARNGTEVDEIINSLLTHDEKMKLGRRIIIAQYLLAGFGIDEIIRELKVGKNTVMHISRRVEKYGNGFLLIEKRGEKVEKDYLNNKYRNSGGSKQIIKTKVYSGIKRKDIKR
ncbi:MAG: hypothetical protein AAB531_01565 [Patescibacteria group bacterium]